MAVIVLIVIGIVVWMMFGSSTKQTIQHRQKKADKEFEDMCFNGASGDDIDDF